MKRRKNKKMEENKDTKDTNVENKENVDDNKENVNNNKENVIDIEKERKTAGENAVAEYLKSLGVEDEKLKEIVKKAKEDEDKNKTDLERKDESLTEALKQLAAERDARIIMEAKLSAIELGAKPELVSDLVIIAKSKVTKDKDINAVIAEIKDSNNGKIYFVSDEDKEDEKKDNKNVTRKRVGKGTENKENKNDNDDNKHEGSVAARLFANRKKVNNHYFKN